MKTPQEKWAISTDGGENYFGDYPAKEEAIAEFKASMTGWHGTGYVGRCIQPPRPEDLWYADDWIEHVSCQDEYSLECAEDWYGSATKTQKEELEVEVRAVMARWLDKHGLRPSFFLIEDAEKIQMEDEP